MSPLASAYLRYPDANPVRITAYPKRRLSASADRTPGRVPRKAGATGDVRSPVSEPTYADFLSDKSAGLQTSA